MRYLIDVMAGSQRRARSPHAAVRADSLCQIHLEMEDNLPLVQAHFVADEVRAGDFTAFSGSECHYSSGSVPVVPGEGRKFELV